MKIAIIGAGVAGLAALRHSLEAKHQCEVYEKRNFVGGVWNFTEETGQDELGLPIHTAMYQGLRTNLPKELMQLEDFPFSTPDHSYVSQPDVLKYINDYVARFKLIPYIKFSHQVVKVSPLEKDRWYVEVKDLKSNAYVRKEFDAIFICVGNYSVPSVPNIQGIEKFKGKALHSCFFKKSECFRDKKVLIVGSGPSGVDIARLICQVSNKVILSHRSPINPKEPIPESIEKKPVVERFTENSVIFIDGTEEVIDGVIFCTGYVYYYPFLSEDCQIKVENQWVKYLYKQVVNINHPTMAFIGIPFRVFPFILFGIQIRFFLACIEGKLIKTKEEMMKDLLDYMNKRKEEGFPVEKAHFLGLNQGIYMDDLAATAKIKPIPQVYINLYKYVHGDGKCKLNLAYRIVNDYEFRIVKMESKVSEK